MLIASSILTDASPQLVVIDVKRLNASLVAPVINSTQKLDAEVQPLNFSHIAAHENSTYQELLTLNPYNLSDTLLITANIQDTTGADISNKISLQMHTTSKRSLAVTNHQTKRTTRSREIDYGCPVGSVFDHSFCVTRSTSLKAYKVSCRVRGRRTYGQPPVVYVAGSCAENEYCVQGGAIMSFNPIAFDRSTRAFCIQTEDFVNVALAGVNAGTTATYNAATSGTFAVDAVLAQPNGETSLFAQSMSIHAQTYSAFFNTEVWGSLPGGDNQCNNCGEIDISPIPAGTKRIKIDVTLPAGVGRGLLLMAVVKSSS
ncbi:hypothetical protein IMSHALPRED_006010 [Imshaugia aleurites]|uniref:Uncharacterized protein n=1 Tax=Imshaugia aleurites TaxID=172621 RepID=A0A8H3FKW3_9LECA|nr:hypothetical protein IMSHALPRED_006010 [Imshaugia aleurites]